MNPVAQESSSRLIHLLSALTPSERITIPTADLVVVLLELQRLVDLIEDGDQKTDLP